MECTTTAIKEDTTIHLSDYVDASSTTEVNDLRLCQKGRDWVQSATTMQIVSLIMHLLRANYQAASWKCRLHARPTLPDPTKCRWIDDDGKLAIH